MENLLIILEELYNLPTDSFVVKDEWNNQKYFDGHELVYEARGLCNELLINNQGSVDWNNIEVLRTNDYNVFPGEKDGFGWLTGCVRKRGDTRILIFG